jgi:hypothetical protein
LCQLTIFQLLARKYQALLVRRNALLVLDLGLDIIDSIRGFNLDYDSVSTYVVALIAMAYE